MNMLYVREAKRSVDAIGKRLEERTTSCRGGSMGANVPCPEAKNSQTDASRTTAPARVVSAARQADRDKAGQRSWPAERRSWKGT